MTTQINESLFTKVAIKSFIDMTFGGKKKRKVDGKELDPFTAKAVQIDATKLPESAIHFVFDYGLRQYIGDGAAGAESQAEFDAGIMSRVDKLYAGDFSRSAGERGSVYDSLEKLTRHKIRETIKAQVKAANLSFTGAQVTAAVEALYNDEALRKPYAEAAQRELDAQKALASGGIDLAALGLVSA